MSEAQLRCVHRMAASRAASVCAVESWLRYAGTCHGTIRHALSFGMGDAIGDAMGGSPTLRRAIGRCGGHLEPHEVRQQDQEFVKALSDAHEVESGPHTSKGLVVWLA